MIIEFTKEELDFISKTGAARHEEMKSVANIADYDPKRMSLTPLQSDKLGVMAEAAVAKWLGYDITNTPLSVWPSFVPKEDLKKYTDGDVNHNGVKYEVRRIERLGNPVPIRKKDIEAGVIIIQVYVPYTKKSNGRIAVPTEAHIIGFCNTTSDYEDGWRPGWAKDRVTRVNDARPLNELEEELVA